MKHSRSRRNQVKSSSKQSFRSKPQSQRGLAVEHLEPRLLLYGTNGGLWPHPELVTVSFMPDGTDISGSSSALISKMNARWSTATWQKEILTGLQNWAANSNLNFSVVADDGADFGSAGKTGSDNNVQGDSNFGDIRIGGFDLATYLGIGMHAFPVNGDTTAGDFFLNTNATTLWNIGSTHDLATVATHEAGHTLAMDHASASTAEMYASYNGAKGTLTSDDIAGIQSKYGARGKDSFDAAASNDSKGSATVITSYVDSNKQIALSNLDITTASDADWYKLKTPSGAASSMTIKMQASGLSLLAPKLELYNSNGNLISGQSVTGTYNTTVQLTQPISAGQVYYIKADGADTTVFGTGRYALEVNMGTAAQEAVPSPNTATAATGTGGASSGQCVLLIPGLCRLLDDVTAGLADALDRPTTASLPNKFAHDEGPLVLGSRGFAPTSAAFASPSATLGNHTADPMRHRTHDAGGNHSAATSSHQVHSRLVDHVADTDPVDVIRPRFALVSELADMV